MNYLQWNNAIINHFFNPENEDKEVMLYFSEAVIEEIGQKNFPSTEEAYVTDFYKALKDGVLGISNDDYIKRILALDEKYKKGCRKIDGIDINYPPVFTYLIALLIPFSSGEVDKKLSAANFHRYVEKLFKEKELTDNYKNIQEKLKSIDYLWDEINNWLIYEERETLGFLVKGFVPQTNREWISRYEYHILFRKDQEEHLSNVFDKYNISPGDLMSEDEMRELLVKNSRSLSFSDKTKKIIDNADDAIGKKIVQRALTFLRNWDGNIGVRGRNRLVLCLDFNQLNSKITLKYFRVFSGNLSESVKVKNDKGFIQDSIYQANSSYSNPINNCFHDLETKIVLDDPTNRMKFIWKNKDFYIFKSITELRDWVEIPRVEFNLNKTLIICKKDYFDKNLNSWYDKIETNKKKLLENGKTELPDNWIAFTIEAISNHPHPSIDELCTEPEIRPKIDFDKSFYIDGHLFKDKLPLVWIEGKELEQTTVFAKYEDGDEIIDLEQVNEVDNNELTHPANKFNFTDKHRAKTNKKFKLHCGDISTQRFLEIANFKKKTNDEIEPQLPKRDFIGQTSHETENYFKGIEPFFSHAVISKINPIQKTLDGVFIKIDPDDQIRQNGTYSTQHCGNILLHYISTKGSLTKSQFNEAVYALLRDQIKVTENVNIKDIAKRLGYDLQNLGYMDYDPDKQNGTFIVNKPNLVVIPSSKGAKYCLLGGGDPDFISKIISFLNEKVQGIKIEFVTNNNGTNKYNLLPQVIFFYTSKCNQELIKPLVKEFNFLYKKNDLHPQFALTSCFPVLSKWKEYIKETPDTNLKDTEGGFIFNLDLLNFTDKPVNFNKHLSLIKITNARYKTIYRLWFEEKCYTISDYKLGIYLYIFLLRERVNKDNIYQYIDDSKYAAEKTIAIDKDFSSLIPEKQRKYLTEKVNDGFVIRKNEFETLKDDDLKKNYVIQIIDKRTNIVIYDESNKLLAVPLFCGLPNYFSLSFQLLSCEVYSVAELHYDDIKYRGKYKIYRNIDKLFLKNTFVNSLLKRGINNGIHKKTINL